MGTKTKNSDGEFYYKWKSYNDIHDETQILANIIRKNNFANDVKDDDFDITIQTLGICSVNREEWLVTDLACNLINVTSVPLYETLGDEML